MSELFGYVAIGIVFSVFLYVLVLVIITQWKEDNKMVVASAGMVLALVIAITGLILKGMGL